MNAAKRLSSGWKNERAKMGEELILIDEVAKRLRLSTSRVRSLLSERRKTGFGIPLPFSQPHSKLRWRASDISHYIESQNAEPIRAPPPRVSPSQLQCEEKARRESDNVAKVTLDRHAATRQNAGRKSK
jgi:predicted DNA-binding transcriptional regulator AlpA